ncbi:hypothetical protein AaE_013878 [Aphanomyces astaci]|uniref:Uncharacterized protein n=1 Tax=Aphanomyces astaci TaxID=112090 RepID=A0A6A4Z2D2_APHAT|nr:hypothetical protein AaE_013878 [Aphanomyces astaci]
MTPVTPTQALPKVECIFDDTALLQLGARQKLATLTGKVVGQSDEMYPLEVYFTHCDDASDPVLLLAATCDASPDFKAANMMHVYCASVWNVNGENPIYPGRFTFSSSTTSHGSYYDVATAAQPSLQAGRSTTSARLL